MTHPLAALSLEADLESRIERARRNMEAAFHFGNLDKAREYETEMRRLIGERSPDTVRGMEVRKGLRK